ncbi:hypothetical protein OIU85_010687 [Salix viminalis]|uniref:DUF4283 domain-containing protein n=1 Tax=Salix viminalis TaxID=40686 RepID=A0A9Q0SET9_SALVM|nr:hypothetical protein OIU85_010687 [Salix viminalis]
MTTTNGFMLFRFKEEEGLHTVVERGPWMFGGKSIILQQWHPHFLFDRNKITSLPVWIRLRGLPFPLWNRAGLSLAASMVGRPIACDEHTHFCTRLDYARICVEVEASNSYVHSFEMDTPLSEVPIRVEVEYEWRPTRCKDCQGSHAKNLAQPTSRAKTATSNQNTTAPIPKHKNILAQNPTTKDIHDQTCQSEESSKNPNTQLICTESRVDPLLSQSIESGSSNSKEDDAASYATRDPPEDWGDTMESTPPSPKTVKRKKGSKKGKGPKGY